MHNKAIDNRVFLTPLGMAYLQRMQGQLLNNIQNDQRNIILFKKEVYRLRAVLGLYHLIIAFGQKVFHQFTHTAFIITAR